MSKFNTTKPDTDFIMIDDADNFLDFDKLFRNLNRRLKFRQYLIRSLFLFLIAFAIYGILQLL